eukprot:622397-Pyramimonas_sp.AAC.1
MEAGSAAVANRCRMLGLWHVRMEGETVYIGHVLSAREDALCAYAGDYLLHDVDAELCDSPLQADEFARRGGHVVV